MPLRKTEPATDTNVFSNYVAYFTEMLAGSTSTAAPEPSPHMSRWMAIYREPNISQAHAQYTGHMQSEGRGVLSAQVLRHK